MRQAQKLRESVNLICITLNKIIGEREILLRLHFNRNKNEFVRKNAFYVDEVETAFMEIDGTVSVRKKPESAPATPKDLQLITSSRGLPQTFIIDGKILENSLASIGKDRAWVDSILQTFGVSEVGDVALAQIDEQNKVYIDKRNDMVH